jgi:hypothetical protein
VPGSFNPGNQAGKGRDVEEDRTREPDETHPSSRIVSGQ